MKIETMGDLRQFVAESKEIPDDRLLALSGDAEGNSVRTMYEVGESPALVPDAEDWEIVLVHPDDVGEGEHDEYHPEDVVQVLVFWPSN